MKVITASAGTGKTTRLAQEYLERVVNHPPHRLAAVTFTRRAAAELKGRIFRALRDGGLEGIRLPRALESRREELAARVLEAPLDTIHGFSELILRLAAPLMDLDPGLQVGDPGRIEGWFLEVARGVAIARGRVLTEDDESALLTLFKGRVLAEDFHPLGPESEELLNLMQEALEIHRRRTRWLLHPGDAERLAAKLIENPDATARVAARLKAVLVDEYQDTNPMQQALFEGLDAAGVEVVVVGDPKQSIFGFRNAVPEGFRRAIGKSAEVHYLDKSYRHPDKLARPLNAFTAREAELGTPGFDDARPVTGVASNKGNPYFAIREIRRSNGLSTEQARALEARLAAHILLHWTKQGTPLRKIMVLVTKRHYARPLQKELRELGLPYAVQGGTDLYQEPEVQELGHLLRFALAGFQAEPVSLAALLTGPFVGFAPGAVSELLKQKDPAAWIRARYPEAWKRIEGIRETFQDRPAGAALSQLVLERGYLELLEEAIADSVVMALSRLARYEDPGEALAAL